MTKQKRMGIIGHNFGDMEVDKSGSVTLRITNNFQ